MKLAQGEILLSRLLYDACREPFIRKTEGSSQHVFDESFCKTLRKASEREAMMSRNWK